MIRLASWPELAAISALMGSGTAAIQLVLTKTSAAISALRVPIHDFISASI
jgi:hypothetical protein